MVSMWVLHLCDWLQYTKDLIVAVAALKINVCLFDKAANQIDCTRLGSDAS
jgi:hypothetical protein